MMEELIWLIYPYSVVVILAMGFIWRVDEHAVENDGMEKRNVIVSYALRILILLFTGTGIAIFAFGHLGTESKYLGKWIVSLVKFQPDSTLIVHTHLLVKLNLLTLLSFMLTLSFSDKMYHLHPMSWLPRRQRMIISNIK